LGPPDFVEIGSPISVVGSAVADPGGANPALDFGPLQRRNKREIAYWESY